MELSFDYAPDRQFYVVRFTAGSYESVPIIREMRFWGVDRAPCPRLSTMAALLALKHHPMATVTLKDAAVNPPVCTALSQYFDVEIHPDRYDVNRRDLAGGEKIVAPARFSQAGKQNFVEGSEALTWISLEDLRGPFGGHVRTNLDAFDLTEDEKNLIIALCCAGRDVGHIVMDKARPELAEVLHRIGLELVDLSDAA
ncbi:hypothetical protein [Tropicimonas sp. S265A]|uniref:hypothetical protein n=1 Tax=Tropicimonas sp. S265A TaxID=3415134 RepID=UPI003C7BBBE4